MSESLQPSKTILLLGASGKIGLEIRRAFHALAPNCKVICCSRSVWEGQRFPNEEWLQLDPFEAEWKIDRPIDIVINAVGAIQETKAMTFERMHQGMTYSILEHRAQMGMPRIVQMSALGASPTQNSLFLQSKGKADSFLLLEKNTVVLRPSIVCTPNTMLSHKMKMLLCMARFGLGKMLVPTGFPVTQIQPIMGSDVGSAVVNAALDAQIQGIVELVGPERITFEELIRLMVEAQGRKVRLVEVSRDIMETFVRHFVGVWFPGLINLEQFRLLFQDNVGDVQQTEQILGRMPHSTKEFWQAEAMGETNAIQEPIPAIENGMHYAS